MYRKRRYSRRGRKIPTKKVAIRKAVRKQSNQKIAKVVKNVLSKQVETKVLQWGASVNLRQLQPSTTNTQFNTQILMLTPQGATIPAIAQGYGVIGNGVGQDQRIGDEIKIKGYYFDYALNCNPYDATFNPLPAPYTVTMWVIQPKSFNGNGLDFASILGGSSTCNFFENQTNTDSGMNGTYADLCRRVDTDNYKVLAKRTHKIGYTSFASTTNQPTGMENNDYKSFVKGRIKLKGHNLKFDRLDRLQQVPVYLLCQCTRIDGVVIAPALLPIYMWYNMTIYFTDP